MAKDIENVERMFPLPLTCMEQLQWFDSSSKFTNQVYSRFRFDGKIDPESADAAARRVIARHPFLTCQVTEQNGKLVWVQNPENIKPIRWDQPMDKTVGPKPIQLGREVPWNVECRYDGDQTEMWFHMSHVIGDGLAGVQIISEWMKCYHQIVSASDSIKGFHRLDPSQLLRRNDLGLTSSAYLKNLWRQPIGLFGASKFIFRKPCPFQVDQVADADWDYESQPAIVGDWLDETSSRKLAEKANSMNVSVNSILVGLLMQTLENFCQKHPDRISKWIRVILPINIRTFADRRMPATNRATVVQVDRQASDFTREDYFSGLNREIQIIRDWDLGKLFLIFIRSMLLFPGAISRAASNQKCRATAVFANLAEPFGRMGLPVEDQKMVVGNLKLHEFDFVGPIRHLMPVNFTSQRFLGRYRISLHYDCRVLPAENAAEVLSEFLNRLSSFAKSST